MVSFVSRRYMRGENGKDSLMVCLSRIAIFVSQNNVIMAYRSVLLIRIGKQNVKIIYIYKSKSKKGKMNYSCHGTYKGIDLVFSLFSLHSS